MSTAVPSLIAKPAVPASGGAGQRLCLSSCRYPGQTANTSQFSLKCLSKLKRKSHLASVDLQTSEHLILVERGWGGDPHLMHASQAVHFCIGNVYHVCVRVWCVQMHAEVRGRHWVSCSVTLHLIPLRRGLSLNLESS